LILGIANIISKKSVDSGLAINGIAYALFSNTGG
jgi:hypothetical protein